jgi:hypothetical protein
MILSERPAPTVNETRVLVVSYTCEETPVLSDTQIKIRTNYTDSNCDTITKKITYRPTSFVISISSTVNSNYCGSDIKSKNNFFYLFLNSIIFYYFFLKKKVFLKMCWRGLFLEVFLVLLWLLSLFFLYIGTETECSKKKLLI